MSGGGGSVEWSQWVPARSAHLSRWRHWLACRRSVTRHVEIYCTGPLIPLLGNDYLRATFIGANFLRVGGSVIQKMLRRCRILSMRNALRWRLLPTLVTRSWRGERDGGCCRSRNNHRVRLGYTKYIGQECTQSDRFVKLRRVSGNRTTLRIAYRLRFRILAYEMWGQPMGRPNIWWHSSHCPRANDVCEPHCVVLCSPTMRHCLTLRSLLHSGFPGRPPKREINEVFHPWDWDGNWKMYVQ